MKNEDVTFLGFTKVVFSKAPGALVGAGTLFLLAGILELFSLAALLPILVNLLGSVSGAGFAGEIINSLGFSSFSFTQTLIAVIALMSMRGLFIFLADFWMARVAHDIEIDTRRRLYTSLIHANWRYLLSLNTGHIANLVLREAERYTRAILQLGQFFSSVLIATVLVASSVLVSWQAFLIFASATVPYLIITKFINIRVKKNAIARVKEANKISAQIGEDTPHLKYIKAGGLESVAEHKFMQATRGYAGYFLRIVVYQRFIQNFPEVFGVLILGALILLSQRYMEESPSDIIFFLLLLFRGYRQIAAVQTILASLLENIPSYQICENAIVEAFSQREKFEGGTKPPAHPLQIEVKNIGFSYDSRGTQALNGATVTIPSQGLIALVGRSGAGKTTLGDILLGLILPQQGEVLVNGERHLSDIDLQTWRRNIGYVPQDAFLTSGTIRQNILLGAEDKSDENLERAARQAHIDDYVRDLPQKYETEVGNLGIRLSGGQKQRIALARALANKPGFLILDEATSALDSQTEGEVQEIIRDIATKIPVVVIAHRLSTIQNADRIFVLDQGKVVESGTFESLLEEKGQFWSLYKADKG